MSEIPTLDNPVMRKLFKILHETYLGTPITLLGVKILEYYGNGYHRDGYHGKRIKFSDFGKIILVGQSHLDAAWRWRTKQGVLKAKATFTKAIDHIENLPEFTYLQPSPQYYAWMKESYPILYKKMKKAVSDGRFIISGGNWVECDNNIPNGESLVRQRMYGQRFYLSEFGHTADVEFMQDCFGFNRNLPQIFSKSGANMFVTGKLFWNETSTIPIGMCHWESPDGTRLPMLHMHFGYFLPLNYGKKYPLVYLLGKPGKKLTANYHTSAKEFSDWRSRDYMMNTFFGYGLGDGGHGPIEAELLITRILRRLWPKRYKFLQRGDMVALMKPYFSRWAVWNDEWYLDQHRGTFTSVSYVKRGNRDAEVKLDILERLAFIAQLFGFVISQTELEKNWKYLLYNQFHDILPGSSIPEVYEDYRKERVAFDQYYNSTIDALNIAILQKMNVKIEYGSPIILFNPLSWDRHDLIEIEIGKYQNGVVRDTNGNDLPTQIVKNTWRTLEPQSDEWVALCDVGLIPSLSLQTLYFDAKADQSPEAQDSVRLTEADLEIVMENKYIKVSIDNTTGLISQIYSKECNHNIFNAPGNELMLFEEHRHTDAWNIDPDYTNYPIKYDPADNNLDIIENGPLRCALKIKRKILKSTFIQTIALSFNSPVLLLSLDIDLRDPKILVKLDFDTNIQTDDVTSEIPYAFIDRAVDPQTLIDKPRWEHACQKWFSIHDKQKNLGISISNNGKYAYNALPSPNGGTILRPTVVRSPKFTGYARETRFVKRALDGGINPTKPQFTDMEHHHDIQYGLLIHTGDWRMGAWQSAYELNYPLRISQRGLANKIPKDLSTSPVDVFNFAHESFGLCQLNSPHIRIGAIKLSEDRLDSEKYGSFIVRMVEQVGEVQEKILSINPLIAINAVEVVNLLEIKCIDSRKIQLSGNEISFTINPYEILTLKITYLKEITSKN